MAAGVPYHAGVPWQQGGGATPEIQRVEGPRDVVWQATIPDQKALEGGAPGRPHLGVLWGRGDKHAWGQACMGTDRNEQGLRRASYLIVVTCQLSDRCNLSAI